MKLHECLRSHGIDPDKVICGAYCGDGWVDLIDELIKELVSLGWDKDLHQIKEKFGLLTCHVGEATEEIYAAINRAERKSGSICEDCGAPGSLKKLGNYWLYTACDNHIRNANV